MSHDCHSIIGGSFCLFLRPLRLPQFFIPFKSLHVFFQLPLHIPFEDGNEWLAGRLTHTAKLDKEDTPDMHDEEKENHLPHFELTGAILGCCFDVES